MALIQIRRGTQANMPSLGAGEPGFCTDTHKLYIGYNGTNYEIGKSETVQKEIYQVSHGFDKDFIYHNGTNWVKALCDGPEHSATHFGVSVDTNNFISVTIGDVDVTGMVDDASQALTAGEYYFLSQNTAGKVMSTVPTSGISQSVLKVNATNEATIIISEPVESSDVVDGGTW